MATFPRFYFSKIRWHSGHCWVKGCTLAFEYKSRDYFFFRKRGYKDLTVPGVREGGGAEGVKGLSGTGAVDCAHGAGSSFLCKDGWCISRAEDGKTYAVKGPLQPLTCHPVGGSHRGQPSQCPRTMLCLSQVIAV